MVIRFINPDNQCFKPPRGGGGKKLLRQKEKSRSKVFWLRSIKTTRNKRRKRKLSFSLNVTLRVLHK
jgi:hypothetical protein